MADKRTPFSESFSTKLRHHPLAALREEMDDVLSRFLGGAEEGWLPGRMAPLADLSETDTTVEVSLDLPGLNPDDIDIHLSGTTLQVRGERTSEHEEKDRTFHRVERRRGTFSRSIALPCPVVDDKVAAEYKDGVLTITLPKCDEAKSRKIEVKH